MQLRFSKSILGTGRDWEKESEREEEGGGVGDEGGNDEEVRRRGVEKNVRAGGAQAGKIRGTVISNQFKMEETFGALLFVC